MPRKKPRLKRSATGIIWDFTQQRCHHILPLTWPFLIFISPSELSDSRTKVTNHYIPILHASILLTKKIVDNMNIKLPTLPLSAIDAKNNPPDYYLWVQDYLTILMGFLWIAAYLLYIRQSYRDQSYGMPILSLYVPNLKTFTAWLDVHSASWLTFH